MLERLSVGRTDEDGFALGETGAVVLTVSILIAVALPTFLGARDRASDKAARSGVSNASVAARTIFKDTAEHSKTAATMPPIGVVGLSRSGSCFEAQEQTNSETSFTESTLGACDILISDAGLDAPGR